VGVAVVVVLAEGSGQRADNSSRAVWAGARERGKGRECAAYLAAGGPLLRPLLYRTCTARYIAD
jgi:hypothetical protein